MKHCTKCGQLLPSTHDADWLLDILTNGTPHREVYRGRDGGWWVTHGGGETSPEAVQELLRRSAIASVYSDCPADAYHVGRTIDIKRTTESRKKLGRRAPLIYTDSNSRLMTPTERTAMEKATQELDAEIKSELAQRS